MKRRSAMLNFVVILALVQAVLGIFRALQWFDVGTDLLGQGIVLLPVVGLIAFARGALIISIALAYVVFAIGLLWRKSWSWWVGLIVSAINVLLVFNVVIHGEPVSRAVLWLIAPISIAACLLSSSGRAAVAQVNRAE